MTLACLIFLAMTAHTARAQQAIQSQGKRLSEVTWTTAGTYVWTRPADVRYVLVRACGGGGGGAGGNADIGGAEGGTCAGGGGAGSVRSSATNTAGGRGGAGGLTLVSVASPDE
jgi:hypothetical protein